MVTANSTSSLSSLREHLGVAHNRVTVIENGVERTGRLEPGRSIARRNLGLPADDLVFCTLASLRAEKRPLFFVDVFRHYRELSTSKAYFIWQGSGPEGPAVEMACAQLPTKDRGYLRFLPGSSNTQEILACSDVFLLTSEYEGMPNALLEAMAAGLPCVVTDVAGTRDVFSAPDGSALGICEVVPPNDPRVFAEALAELARNSGRMRTIGQKAMEHVQRRFAVETMVERHIEVFKQVLTSRTEC
jgi:glycosyltransferase involved in cell wall biosynthesis